MGGEEAPVKSTDVESAFEWDLHLSKKLQNTLKSCTLGGSIFEKYTELDVALGNSGERRARGTSGRAGSAQDGEPPGDGEGDGGPDEAVLFIAETVAALAAIARRHELGMLVRLLEMAQMEAEEGIRIRGKRTLS
jgi:hypothetical protein